MLNLWTTVSKYICKIDQIKIIPPLFFSCSIVIVPVYLYIMAKLIFHLLCCIHIPNDHVLGRRRGWNSGRCIVVLGLVMLSLHLLRQEMANEWYGTRLTVLTCAGCSVYVVRWCQTRTDGTNVDFGRQTINLKRNQNWPQPCYWSAGCC